MKYLKIQLSTEERGVIYERDVQVRSAFREFVRVVVSDLLQNGTLNQGEHYAATIIPRYGDQLLTTPRFFVNSTPRPHLSDYIELDLDESVQLDNPVRYFTLEIWITERNMNYRCDYQVAQIAHLYVGRGITQALLQLGILQNREVYLTRFFVCDDDLAVFNRERFPTLEQSSADLLELDDEIDASASFAERDPDEYGNIETVGAVTDGDVQIYLRRDIKDKLLMEAAKSSTVELGGFLVGSVYSGGAGRRQMVEISDLIVSENALSSVTELTYTFDSWLSKRSRMEELREQYPGKQIVGWYHTHVIEIAIYKNNNTEDVEQTSLFFSSDDVFLHSSFFKEEWYVAMVLTPDGNSIFFQWKNGEIRSCPGYFIYDDLGIAEPIASGEAARV